MGGISQSILKLFCSLSSLLRRTEKEGNIIMRYLASTGLLMIYCFFSLFYTRLDIFYVLAFLCVFIFCCMDYFCSTEFPIRAISYFYLGAAFFMPSFLIFLPAAAFVFLHHKNYVPLAPLVCLYCWHVPAGTFKAYALFTGAFGLVLSYFLLKNADDCEKLGWLYRHTRDDSTEHTLLLKEKNQALLEKQDYEIYSATLRERNRIAREIHDNVGHLLSRAILLVGAAKTISQKDPVRDSLETLGDTLGQAMDSIRSSVHDLHDETVNLEETLQNLVQDFTFCPVTFKYDMGRDIPREVKYCFISITKEAFSNIIKHSNATHVALLVREHPALYQLCIEDNGTLIQDEKAGMGLMNMQERILSLKGNIQIHKENGYRIFITLPKEL